MAGGISRAGATGATFEPLTATSAFPSAAFALNGAGTLILLIPNQGIFAYSASMCSPRGPADVARSSQLLLFSDDRLFANPFVSVVTTSW